jgi:hypothetical protein
MDVGGWLRSLDPGDLAVSTLNAWRRNPSHQTSQAPSRLWMGRRHLDQEVALRKPRREEDASTKKFRCEPERREREKKAARLHSRL